MISVDPGGHVKAGDVIARIPTESAKTRDITGGLPRVAELFEARRPKEAATIAEIAGTVRFGKDYKNKRRLTIESSEKGVEAAEYLIPKGKHIHLQDGDAREGRLHRRGTRAARYPCRQCVEDWQLSRQRDPRSTGCRA